MPKQILPQPIAKPPPELGAPPTIAFPGLSRRDVFTAMWTRRIPQPRTALGAAMSRVIVAARPPGAGRNRRQSARKGAQR
ncbi:MAG TPA: hypothetical protein VGZ32_03090 [Actinocrinis sp.]|nr:hypothetical protein [Actinocrinis sp.]